MAAPKDRELGVRSPFKLRAGIDFPSWEGVNRQNDPGAIRDTQFQTAVNVRLNGNEVVSRGGQTRAYATGITGCVYGMIDVDGSNAAALNIYVWDYAGKSNKAGTVRGLIRINTAGAYDATFPGNEFVHVYYNIITSPTVFDMSANPIRDVIPFQGKLYVFGEDPTSLVTGLWEVSVNASGEFPTSTQTIAQELADFNSFVVRSELTTNGANEAMYIGTKASNTVYRWDGTTLTTEATGVGSGALIMFQHAGEIYAASTNSLKARGGGSYSTSYAMPGGVTTFVPFRGVEYVNQAFICGSDVTAGNRSKVLSFNGTTLSVSYAPTSTGATSVFCDLAVGGGYAWFSYTEGFNQTILAKYTGAWADVLSRSCDSNAFTGCLLGLDNDLFWWTSWTFSVPEGQTKVVLQRIKGYSVASVDALCYSNGGGPGDECPTDMNVLS